MMKRYLDHISSVITKNQGTLDKYKGDAVMAFYGAPVPSEEHAANACRTVIACGSEWSVNGKSGTGLRTRFGINTGRMLVGNVGSERRFNYTVMGDQVNVGGRCESACKSLGIYAAVTEATVMEVGRAGEFLFRFLGSVTVKRRSEPLELYQLLGFRDEAGEELIGLVERFEEGVALYRKGALAEAENIFADIEPHEYDLLKASEEINPSAVYPKACREASNADEQADWRGVIGVG